MLATVKTSFQVGGFRQSWVGRIFRHSTTLTAAQGQQKVQEIMQILETAGTRCILELL